jgi:hypothetical protein
LAVQKYVDTASPTGGNGDTTSTTGGDPNRAYASLSEWEANQTNVDDDFIVDCAASGGSPDTTAVVVNFANISSGSILIQQSGANANTGNAIIDTNKYRLAISTGTSTFRTHCNKTTLRRMQLENTNTGSFIGVIQLNSGFFRNLVIEYCRIRWATASGCMTYNGSNGTANPFGDSNVVGGTNIIRNNIFQCLSTGGTCLSPVPAVGNASATDLDIYQNTFYMRGSVRAINISGWSGAAAQNVNIKNNVVANTTDALALQANTASYVCVTDYNWLSSSESTTNEQTLPSLASTFTSHGTLQSSDFSLLQALATGGTVGSITDDIIGTSRGSPPDAGAFEFASGGGSISATFAVTLDNLTQASTLAVTVAGVYAQTLPLLTQAATGTVLVQANASITLDLLTQAATGTVGDTIHADVAATLGLVTQSATATALVQAAVAQALPNITQAAAAALTAAAAVGVTLDPPTIAAVAGPVVKAQVAKTLELLQQNASGLVGVTIRSVTVDVTLGDLVLTTDGHSYSTRRFLRDPPLPNLKINR